jgi:diacylglycerol kinase (ATP)
MDSKSGMLRAAAEDRQSMCNFAADVKPFIIFNPTAGSVTDEKRAGAELKRLRPVTIAATKKRGDAEKLAREMARRGCDYLIVAGGDGTLNEVVNGIARTQRSPKIGILPLGTGNDFARTLGLPISLEENIAILRAGKTRAIDIVRVRSDRARYFVNVAAGGFSGIVRKKTTPEIKKTWGPLAYIRGAAAALPKLHAYKTRIVLDGDEEFSAVLYNVIIANGRFAAGGLSIAPDADPADALLDVVLIPKCGAAELALLAAEIVLGKHFSSNTIIFRRAKKVSVRSRPGMWFNVDGELVGSVPAMFQIVPRALRLVVKQ